MPNSNKIRESLKSIQDTLKPPRIETITIPDNVAILVDKKTGVKSISFPFQFNDGIPGFLTLTRLVKMGWIAADDISEIIIKFK